MANIRSLPRHFQIPFQTDVILSRVADFRLSLKEEALQPDMRTRERISVLTT